MIVGIGLDLHDDGDWFVRVTKDHSVNPPLARKYAERLLKLAEQAEQLQTGQEAE